MAPDVGLWTVGGEGCADALAEQGVWFQDDAVPLAVGDALREEILMCHAQGKLTQSGNVLAIRTADGTRRGHAYDKPHVFEADVITNGGIRI
eukprot:TRINITY_DN29666_c0_g1_i1.p1 TRINITY_DN29666_c0_g1~~TRINITY_DN29666_c0_g1_i1.p1  ORF type:complete len:102 (+),score=23.39 TRINITY_DN29666_c0_g1_i1:33-308(+)